MQILIVTVGSNPVPVYVGVKYFLEGSHCRDEDLPFNIPDKILFLYSNETKKYFKVIIELLRKHRSKLVSISLENDSRNANFIMKQFKSNLEKFHNIKKINFLFTGGTKSMAIYGNVSLIEYCRLKNIELYYSDINPEENSLHLFDYSKKKKNCIQSGHLNKIVDLSLQNLFKLHLVRYIDSKDKVPSFYNIENVKYFLKLKKTPVIKENGKEIDKYKEFFNKIQNFMRNKSNKILKYDQNYEPIGFWERNQGQNSIQKRDSFLKKLEENKLNNFSNILKKNYDDFSIWHEILTYVSGGWLECYIMDILKNYFSNKNCQYHIFLNIIPKIEYVDKNGLSSYRRMEMDVILLLGYQLHLFTVTTSSNISTVKQKAFEGLFRANQLGGSNSKLWVISLLNNQKGVDLKMDLQEFNAINNTTLICIDDILNKINGKLNNKIDEKLKEFFLFD